MSTSSSAKIQDLRSLVLGRLTTVIQKHEPALLYDAMRYAVSVPGKLLRPSLLLLCCDAVGGDHRNALDAAIALELIHTFTLVHDDIMDHDSLRRGQETVHKKWDEAVAILAGDGLLVVAFSLLANIKTSNNETLMANYCQAILEVCEGQAMDKEFESQDNITLEQYFDMIDKKTGRLFELACEAGAQLGNGSEKEITALKHYGALLGRAFQIQDDLLDVLGVEATIGKNVGSDLEAKKKTFLLTHAYQHANNQQLRQLHKLMEGPVINANKLKQIIALLTQIGTIDAAKKNVSDCLRTAEMHLSIIANSEAKAELTTLLHSLATRNY